MRTYNYDFNVVPTVLATTRTKNICLMASFPGQPEQEGTRKVRTILDFNAARDDRVAVASTAPYANRLQLIPDRQPRQHLIIFLHAECCS